MAHVLTCWLIITMKKQLIIINQLLFVSYLLLLAGQLQSEENTKGGHGQCSADDHRNGVNMDESKHKENAQEERNSDNAGNKTHIGQKHSVIVKSNKLHNEIPFRQDLNWRRRTALSLKARCNDRTIG